MFAKTSNHVCVVALLISLVPPHVVAAAPGIRPDCVEYFDRLRRRPGSPPREGHRCDEPGLAPAVWGEMPFFAAIPDRWRIVNSLGYPERLLDPYHGNNVLKGDRPAFGKDWFFSLNLISDSTVEERSIPTPVAIATTPNTGSLDLFGDPDQTVFVQNFVVETVLYKGETIFKPPDYEIRFLPVFNLSHLEVDQAGILRADSTADTSRDDHFVGIQGLFLDKHLRNVSDRYDFDSLRIGIQPITADFRGFLFRTVRLGCACSVRVTTIAGSTTSACFAA